MGDEGESSTLALKELMLNSETALPMKTETPATQSNLIVRRTYSGKWLSYRTSSCNSGSCSVCEQKGSYKCPKRKMQQLTEKMLTDVQKEIASVLSVSTNVKTDNTGDSSTNSSSSFDI